MMDLQSHITSTTVASALAAELGESRLGLGRADERGRVTVRVRKNWLCVRQIVPGWILY